MRRFGWGDRESLIPLGNAWHEPPQRRWSGAKATWIWTTAGAAVLTVIAAWLFADTITPWLRQVWEWVH